MLSIKFNLICFLKFNIYFIIINIIDLSCRKYFFNHILKSYIHIYKLAYVCQIYNLFVITIKIHNNQL